MGISGSKSEQDLVRFGPNEQAAIYRQDRWKCELLEAISLGQLGRVRQLSSWRLVLNSAEESQGRTPLQVAVQLGKVDIVRCLIKAGADVNRKDKSRMTALHIAAAKGYTLIAEEILQGKGEVLLNERDMWGWTPLHKAVVNQQEDTAILLLNYGARINVPDDNKRTVLHTAAADGSVGLLRRLLSLRADVNWQDAKKRTPLYLAVVGRQAEVVKLLVDQGCNLDLPTVVGFTPLYLAIKKGMAEIVELLVNGGAKSVPESEIIGNIDNPLLVHLINLGCTNNGTSKKAESFLQIACLLIQQDGTPMPPKVMEALLSNYSLDNPHMALLNKIMRLLLLSGVTGRFAIPDSLPKDLRHFLYDWSIANLPPAVPSLVEICRRKVRQQLHAKCKNVVYSVGKLDFFPKILKDFILLQA